MAQKHSRAREREIDIEASGPNPNYYANAVNVLTSLYDVTIQFRVEAPLTKSEEGTPPLIEIISTCSVRMSPQHAKALASILSQQIKQYEEENHVTLPIEPRLAAIWEQLTKK